LDAKLIVEVAHAQRSPHPFGGGEGVNANGRTHAVKLAAEVGILDDFGSVLSRELLEPILCALDNVSRINSQGQQAQSVAAP
jgi:hypothetical protein